MNFSIDLSKVSRKELKDIFDYFSNYNIKIADKFLVDITEFMKDNLSFMPEMFRIYKENIRLVPYGNYLIFYKINYEENIVQILHIVHGARELSQLKF